MDYLLQDFSLDIGLWSFDIPNQCEQKASPDSVTSPVMADIERFLMEEEQNEEENVDYDGFFTSLFVQGDEGAEKEVGAGFGSDGGEVALSVDHSGEKTSSDDEAQRTLVDAPTDDARESNTNGEDGDGDGDDQMTKKRKRQMRNRESAMKSRERKKEYVKELEMKSKYLEQECRRLDYAFRCCAAENLALRQRLHMEAANVGVGASTAKQESAVLFMESLLLGSLFVLVSTVFLFLMPNLDSQRTMYTNIMARDLGKGVALGRKMTYKREETLCLGNLMKRCRGMRTRIKFILIP